MKHKITMCMFTSVMVVLMTTVALAKVYNKEKVSSEEVAKYFGANWREGNFKGGKLYEMIATESYIDKFLQNNKRARTLHDEALEKNKTN